MTAGGLLVALAIAIAVQRGFELRLAARNAAWARREGAVEHGAGHYRWFFVLHGAWSIGWIVEAWWRGPSLAPGWPLALAAFGLAQGLRYWAIATLGPRWNTRILVLPGRAPIVAGPYRVLRHPNYVAVIVELVSVPAVFGAWITATVIGLANLVLLLGVRIPAEEAALAAATPPAERGEQGRQ